MQKAILKEMFVPLSIHYNRFYCLNGGNDTSIFAPDSRNLFHYFKDHGVETQCLVGTKVIRNLGCFWVHLGMIKRYFMTQGEENIDFISIKSFLHTHIKKLRIQVKAYYTSDYKGAMDNIHIHLENDKKYIRELLKDDIKENQACDDSIHTK